MHLVLVSLHAIIAPSPTSPVGTETNATLGFLDNSASVETANEMRVFKIKTNGCVKPMLKVMLKMLMLLSLFTPLLLNAL